MKVVLVDYSVGNIFSVEQALRFLGIDFDVDVNGKSINGADLVIVPGVASFGTGVENLEERGQAEALREFHERGRPLIGLCLGAQMFFRTSSESPSTRGLGFVAGHVASLDHNLCQVPQQGWSKLQSASNHTFSEFDSEYFYFSHSYKMCPDLPMTSVGLARHSKEVVTAFFVIDNLLGVQFHPERSGLMGLKFLDKAIKTASIWE